MTAQTRNQGAVEEEEMEEEIVCNRWKDLTGDQINGPAVLTLTTSGI